jgi:hypothetical protein
MGQISANDLKTKGIAAIELTLTQSPAATVSDCRTPVHFATTLCALVQSIQQTPPLTRHSAGNHD